MATRAVEDYLKAIYKLQRDGSPATTNAIAEILGLRAASVTAMVQQISKNGMAEYTPYRGAVLTEKGLTEALRVIRRHRLIELYLHQQLAVPWDQVHDEAERLEHAISPYLEERIDASLGYPKFDPHGAPIPTSTGALPERDLVSLFELPLNTSSTVRHIPDDDSNLLRVAANLGLMPDVTVTVIGHNDNDGFLTVQVDTVAPEDRTPLRKVSGQVARHVFVSRPA
jgi:DtxR family transcriptional regulator, Mn-dependent transcriptional regulator